MSSSILVILRPTLAAVLSFALAAPAVAQALRVEFSNSGVPTEGVVDVTVPNALAEDTRVWQGVSEQIGGITATKGASYGSAGEGYTVLHLSKSGPWPRGIGQVELEPQLQADTPADQFQPHPRFEAQARENYAPRLLVKGVPIVLGEPRTVGNSAKQITVVSGTTETGAPVHARLEMSFGAGVPYFGVEGEIVLSGFGEDAVPLLDLQPGDVQIDFGQGVVLWDLPVDKSIRADGDDDLHAAASYSFACRVLGKPAGSTVRWPAGTGHLLARLAADQWNGHVLTYKRICCERVKPLPSNWKSGPRNIDAPANTGGRPAFGVLAGQEAFTCSLLELPTLLAGLREETLRPVHHRDRGGLPVDMADHPHVRVFHGTPDARAPAWGVPKELVDMLSFANGQVRSRLRSQDEAHLALGYPSICAMLTNSAHARWYLSDELDMRLASLDWYVSSPRGVGRMLKAMAQLHCLVDSPGEEERRARVRQWVQVKAESVVKRVDSMMKDEFEVWPGYVSERPDLTRKILSGDVDGTWAPYQQSLMADGFAQWMALDPTAVPAAAWQQQLRICRTVVDHGFYDLHLRGGKRVDPLYVVGWKKGVPLASMVDGQTVKYAGATTAFRYQIGICAVIVLTMDTDVPAATRARAEEILACETARDWDWVRWRAPMVTEN